MDVRRDDVWVIIRSTGEYSDRLETAIRWCRSEEDAQAAVTLAAIEAQRDERPEYPDKESSYHWVMDDGTVWDTTHHSPPPHAKYKPKPNHAEIEAADAAAVAEFERACLALGHVDPEGSQMDAEYHYERVTFWKPAEATDARAA